MRTIPFREVLYDIARKNSIDPESGNFLEKEAFALGVFIDQWVRRTYPGADWPEWTTINQFAPSNHIVTWDAFAQDMVGPNDRAGFPVRIGRVFKTYLVDPRTTSAPVGTDHTLLDSGIHCGFEHGSFIWLKYMPPAPRFNAQKWRPDETYKKDDIRYSSTTGECYRSKVSGNLGHDPSTTFSPPPNVNVAPDPIELDTEITQELVPGNPGIPAQDQILQVTFVGTLIHPIPNPPLLNARFFVEVVNATGALVGNATSMGDGTTTLDQIVTDLSNQLISALSGFTVTVTPSAFTIRISDDSNFKVNQAFWGLFAQPNRNVPIGQLQSYLPAVPPTTGTKQEITFQLSTATILPGSAYALVFRDVAGGDHTVTYVAQQGDGPLQVQSGLIAQIQQATATDPFFNDIGCVLDMTTAASTFSSSTAISIGAKFILPGSPWWELQLMPVDLADQIMRGASADLMKEWGQTQAGMAEEQVVPTEAQATASKYATQQTPVLTGQQDPSSKYKIG